jgi:hypothetical protein
VTCPHCHRAFPPEQHAATRPRLLSFEELPYAEFLRMYQEPNRLDSTPAACCPRCREWVPLPNSNTNAAAQQAESEWLQQLPYDELVKHHREVLGLDEEGMTR